MRKTTWVNAQPPNRAKTRAAAALTLYGFEEGRWRTDTIFRIDGSPLTQMAIAFTWKIIYFAPRKAREEMVFPRASPSARRTEGQELRFLFRASSIGGGFVFGPHVAPPKQTATSEY